MTLHRSWHLVTSALLLAVTTLPSPVCAVPLRLDYTVTDIGGGLFDYEFFLVVDDNDGTFVPGQVWDWLVFGDQQSTRSNLTGFVGDPNDLPIGPWTSYLLSFGFHNGPTFLAFPDPGWIPGFIGDSLNWSGTSTANLGQGELLWSTLITGGGANPAVFTVANLQRLDCLALTSQETVCHPDGTTFTLNVEGVSACTGDTMSFSFTGSGGAVGEDLCFTIMLNDDQGGFCCSAQVCVPVPDCSQDCNDNGIPDFNEIADGISSDCNGNGIPDECIELENDCNGNGIPDECDIISQDCNGNGVPDECDIADGTSTDFNGNGTPDECELIPPNDNCDDAGVVTDGIFPFGTTGATTDGFTAICDGNNSAIVKDIWFAYTPECDGIATFSTCNTADFDTRVAVYFATGCPPGAPLVCSDNAPGCGETSHVELTVFEGFPYLVRVGGTSGGGLGTLTISCGSPSPGDLDGDGIVGVMDLIMLLGQFGPCAAECYADLDGDGMVGVTDLLILLGDWTI